MPGKASEGHWEESASFGGKHPLPKEQGYSRMQACFKDRVTHGFSMPQVSVIFSATVLPEYIPL
jgi:hypothetical protein